MNPMVRTITNRRSLSSWGRPTIQRSQTSLLSTSRPAAVRHHSLSPLTPTDLHFPIAREERQFYTLNLITAAETVPPPADSTPPSPSTAPDIPASRSLPKKRTSSGPVRTKKSSQARMRTGPLPAALKARVLALQSGSRKANGIPTNTSIGSPQSSESTLASPTDNQPPHSPPAENVISDNMSDTSATPESHPTESETSNMSIDEEVPPVVTTSNAVCDAVIQLTVNHSLGFSALVETPLPTLLSADQDERPRWLLTSIRNHLRYGPYYACLSKVVDLFLAQEARLGYPVKVSKHSSIYVLTPTDFVNPPVCSSCSAVWKPAYRSCLVHETRPGLFTR
jgi:hypothetical protein